MFFLFSFIFGFCVVNIQVYQLCCCEQMLRLIWSTASGTSFHSVWKVLRALPGQTFGTFKKGWFYIYLWSMKILPGGTQKGSTGPSSVSEWTSKTQGDKAEGQFCSRSTMWTICFLLSSIQTLCHILKMLMWNINIIPATQAGRNVAN